MMRGNAAQIERNDRRMLDSPNFSFQEAFRNNARSYADKVAVIEGNMRLTYAQFYARANQVANMLIARGLRPGDRIVIWGESGSAFLELMWGTWMAGGVVAPLNYRMAPEAVPTTVENAEPRFIFADAGAIEALGIESSGAPWSRADLMSMSGPRPAWADANRLIDEAPGT